MSPALPAVSFTEPEIRTALIISNVKKTSALALSACRCSIAPDNPLGQPVKCEGNEPLPSLAKTDDLSILPRVLGLILPRASIPSRSGAPDRQRVMAIMMPRRSTSAVLTLAHGPSRQERLNRLLGFDLGQANGVEERFIALFTSHHDAFSRG